MSKKNKTKKEKVVDENVATPEQDQQAKNADTANSKEADEKDDITKLQEEVEKEKERYLRLFAEFENYKRRTGRERVELFKTAVYAKV